ncbi:MAG TPA: hypothetical protein VJH06_03455 [Candidatus Paceibacterota bacterium]
MANETRNCPSCKKDFSIEAEDFNFYEKVRVPPPTWCMECRQMRRMSFRNERILYKRKCDKTGKDIISVYSPDSPHKVFDHSFWYSDNFDPMEYGQDYDFPRPFFEQMREFMLKMPWPSLRIENSENCDYNNDTGRSKDCYLCARTHNSTNALYGYRVNKSRDCVDSMQVFDDSEFLYECVECISCRFVTFSMFSENCSNSSMLLNCKNCLDCFMCTNLRNKQYCFKNTQLTKEEYAKKIAEYNSGSFSDKENALKDFAKLCEKTIHRNLTIINSPNSTGDNIVGCKNAFTCFGIKDCENVRYIWDNMRYKDSMDTYSGGDAELAYECTSSGKSYNVKFCLRAVHSNDAEYSFMVDKCKNVFACIGLQNKEFCIFNKQYSEADYKIMVAKIIEQMTLAREYGEFCPMELSMFAYNETVAQEYFPMTKEEALGRGLRWQDPNTKNYSITVKPADLPDDIKDVKEVILTQSIGCEDGASCKHGCTTAFRIIPRELEFYKRMNLPLPRKCPNCRYYGRLGKLNPSKLWRRDCQCGGPGSENGVYKNLSGHHLHGVEHCPNDFETSFAPDRPEIVYCEKCYQQEVY